MALWLVECVNPATGSRTLELCEAETGDHARATLSAQGYSTGNAYPSPQPNPTALNLSSIHVPGAYYREWVTITLAIAGALVIAGGALLVVSALVDWTKAPRVSPAWPYVLETLWGLGVMIGGTIYWGFAHIASTTHHAAQDIVRAIREAR